MIGVSYLPENLIWRKPLVWGDAIACRNQPLPGAVGVRPETGEPCPFVSHPPATVKSYSAQPSAPARPRGQAQDYDQSPRHEPQGRQGKALRRDHRQGAGRAGGAVVELP